jgi:hypothetical protein
MMRLQLILDVTYTDGVAEDVLRQMLDNLVLHAVNEGMLTGETKAEVESYSHRIETVPSEKIQVSKPLQEFFAVEIRNEDGATLDSALCSWVQAPDDILADWTGAEGDEQLEQLEKELRQLIERCGPDTHLASLVDTD